MALVAWIVLAPLALLLALLAIPLDLDFSVQRREGRQQGHGTLGWLFGVVRLRLGNSKVRDRAQAERPRIKRRRHKPGGAHRVIAMLRSEGFGRRLLKLARDLLRRIHIRELRLNLRLGLDDPADTGRLWAVLGPLAAMLALLPHAHVTIEPAFSAEAFEIDGHGHIRVIPIQLLFVILVFVLSPTTLRALRTMRSEAR